MTKKNNTLKAIGVVALIAVLLVLVFSTGLLNTQIGDTPAEKAVAGSCEIEPYISNSTFNALAKGTAIAPALSYIVEGSDGIARTLTPGTSGTTFVVGDKVKIISVLADYLDNVKEITITRCGSNTFENLMYATDDSTIQIFNSLGNVVTDGTTVGTTNQSSSATDIDMEVKFIANSKQSSGDLVYVIDVANTTQVDDVIISGATKVAVPEFFTAQATGSLVRAYMIPALVDGASKVYNMKITPESGKTIGAVENDVLTTAYSMEWHIDTDGSFAYTIQDLDGTSTAEDDFDYDFAIV